MGGLALEVEGTWRGGRQGGVHGMGTVKELPRQCAHVSQNYALSIESLSCQSLISATQGLFSGAPHSAPPVSLSTKRKRRWSS